MKGRRWSGVRLAGGRAHSHVMRAVRLASGGETASDHLPKEVSALAAECGARVWPGGMWREVSLRMLTADVS